MKRIINKNEKGITLISLVITIIVLLLLAGVAISMLSGENGIITKTNSAKTELDKAELNEAKTLDEYEAIIDDYTGENAPNELAKYILGPEGEGRDLSDIIDFSTGSLKKDPLDLSSTVNEKIKMGYIKPEEPTTLYLRYDRDVYKFDFTFNETTELPEKSLKGSLAFVNSPEGNLGKYVTYKGNTWIVLRDDTSGVELISANALGNVDLTARSFEEARTLYNDAFDLITNECKATVGITNNIRSVGGPISDSERIESNMVKFNDFTTFSPSVSLEEFAQYEGVENGFIKDDNIYLSDYQQMLVLGIVASDNLKPYWLPSRQIIEAEESNNEEVRKYVNFGIRRIMNSGTHSWQEFCSIDDEAKAEEGWNGSINLTGNISYQVRPVIVLEEGILNNKTQTGLYDDPIVLE